MPDQQPRPEEVVRALQLADGYLAEAQDVLWDTAAAFSDEKRNHELEALTEEIWTLQSRIYDLQREFNQ